MGWTEFVSRGPRGGKSPRGFCLSACARGALLTGWQERTCHYTPVDGIGQRSTGRAGAGRWASRASVVMNFPILPAQAGEGKGSWVGRGMRRPYLGREGLVTNYTKSTMRIVGTRHSGDDCVPTERPSHVQTMSYPRVPGNASSATAGQQPGKGRPRGAPLPLTAGGGREMVLACRQSTTPLRTGPCGHGRADTGRG